ncbi:MAG: MarR family transcriptional regulator [Pseudorhodobacter sp.]
MTSPHHILALIKRLARLDVSEVWETDLNPAQIAALDYLACANRFSRAPSHVAEYLGTTRGTMSQTLKALTRKGYVSERRSDADRRSISYDLTEAGKELVARHISLAKIIATLPAKQKTDLSDMLSNVLKRLLAVNNGRAFGICKTCIHHQTTGDRAYCSLLSVPLSTDEAEQICHEQVAA